jgi:PAS domain-containing protein
MANANPTERKPDHSEHTDAQLRQEREESLRIVDLIPQTIIVLNPSGKAIYANRVVLEYTGLSLDDVQADDFSGSRIPSRGRAEGSRRAAGETFRHGSIRERAADSWERRQISVVPDPLQPLARRKRKGRTLVRNGNRHWKIESGHRKRLQMRSTRSKSPRQTSAGDRYDPHTGLVQPRGWPERVPQQKVTRLHGAFS